MTKLSHKSYDLKNDINIVKIYKKKKKNQKYL